MKLPMKQFRRGYLPLALLVQSVFACFAFPAAAQIVNEAQVTFTGGTAAGTTSATSNEVLVGANQSALQLVKTADRAAAEPGDTIIYRLVLTNSGIAASDFTITDTLPLGVQFIERSLRASLTTNGNTQEVQLTNVSVSNRTASFRFEGELDSNSVLTVVYAATVTPDAIRGRGRNLAIASTASGASSNSASHLVRIRPGILSDCGTLIGRVFVDKNFDGEQQPGEPGVPNAVIFMDDGNRITTDADGLFSLAHVLPGYRTGTLDLTSLPGYTLAPNLRRIDKNSASRLVRMAPGSLRRMNFAVTPAFGEDR